MKKNTTKVSVIMGVFNGEKTVERAIDSILNQSFQNFEIVVCNDASTDDTLETLKKIALKDNRIKILNNSKNLKLSKTLNKCINESSGEYIARLDDDDYCEIDRLEKQVNFLDDNLDYDLVGSSRRLFDENGIWGVGKAIDKPTKLDVFKGHAFVHPSILIRKSTLERVNHYSTTNEVERVEDYDLWCKIYNSGGKGYNLQEPLINYYEGENSFPKRKLEFRVNEINLKLHWKKEFNLSPFYYIWCFKPFISHIIPISVFKYIRKFKFPKTELKGTNL